MLSNCLSGPNNYQHRKVCLVADILGIDIKGEFTSQTLVLRINGLEIKGANAIIRSLAKLQPVEDLFGRGFSEYAAVESYIDHIAFEVEPYLELWVQAHGNNLDSETAKSIREELQEKLWNLERLMNPQGDYLVGDQLTLADVCLISALFEPSSLSEDLLRETPNLNRYVSTVGNLDSVRKIFGNLKETSVLDCSSEFSEQANISEIRDKLRTEELSGIWSQLKQFTLWKVHYRYSEYNIVVSVSLNKVHKLLEAMKTVGGICGSISVNGDERPFEITGALCYEGNEIQSYLSSVKESAFYTFEKLNIANVADRQAFQDYLTGASVKGKKVKERVWL